MRNERSVVHTRWNAVTNATNGICGVMLFHTGVFYRFHIGVFYLLHSRCLVPVFIPVPVFTLHWYSSAPGEEEEGEEEEEAEGEEVEDEGGGGGGGKEEECVTKHCHKTVLCEAVVYFLRRSNFSDCHELDLRYSTRFKFK